MAKPCADCKAKNKRRKALVNQSASATAFATSDVVNTIVTLKNGVKVNIGKPLLTGVPPLGWDIAANINNTTYRFSGTPQDIADAVRNIFDQNKIAVTDAQIWYDLNMAWLKGAAKSQCLITTASLTDQVVSNPTTVNEVTPEIWGHKGWGILQAFLAQSDYTPATFTTLLGILEDMLADSRIGCPECHEHLIENRETLSQEPEQEDAKKWVWSVMNEIRKVNNKPTLTYAQAQRVNFWT